MSHNPYDYSKRSGVLPISWEDFHGLCKALALAIAPWDPQAILPIGRAGYYAGTLLAHLLRAEIYPVRVSRRLNDIVERDSPQWLLEPPSHVQGQRVLLVDEISSTGETLEMVREKVMELEAAESRSAVLYAHSWGAAVPDYIGLISDALIVNPWDREILQEGEFKFHPEYAAALALQGLMADAELLIPATPFVAAKIGPS